MPSVVASLEGIDFDHVVQVVLLVMRSFPYAHQLHPNRRAAGRLVLCLLNLLYDSERRAKITCEISTSGFLLPSYASPITTSFPFTSFLANPLVSA